MAAIVHHNDYERPHHCTGTVISNEYILTAAHCVNETNFDQKFQIIVGQLNIVSRKTKRLQIAGHVQHPKYILEENAEGYVLRMDNDIAVVKLKIPLKFSKTYDFITGIRELPYVFPDVLLEGTVAFRDFQECQSQSSVPLEKKMHLCAQGTSTFTLEGDSGGPLFVKSGLTDEQGRPRWIEVGVTSMGTNKGRDTFARVSSYCGFIKNATEGKVKCLS
ncbi:trypsin domain-containing protein [Ditylenchus destructor]|nr:trypsin domain-containing protein [Ditylenchus destructor]